MPRIPNFRIYVKTLKEAIPDLATDLVRELGNAKAANEQIFSLNEFILKTA